MCVIADVLITCLPLSSIITFPSIITDGSDFLSIHRVFEFPPNCDDEGTTMSDPITVTILPGTILGSFVCRMVNLSHPRIIAGEDAKVFIIGNDS